VVAEDREIMKEILLFIFRLFDDFRLGIEILFPFEGRGNVSAETFDEGAHIAFEGRALPC